MPSLHIFGRRWAFASDDLVFPATTEAILRLVWFVIAFCLYTIPGPQQSQPCVPVLADYIIILLVLNALLIAVCFAIAFVSAQGTIFNAYPRRHLSMLLYLRLPLFLCEVGVNVFGTIGVSTPHEGSECGTRIVASVWTTVCLEWLVIFIFIVGLYLVFDPFHMGHHHNRSMAKDNAKQVWKRRLRFFFLCANADDNAKTAFEEVAELLTDFFGDMDLVPSDVWAGLLLLANKDMSIMADSRMTEPHPPGSVEMCERPSWMNLKYASRMADFAMGVYGWPQYIWNNCGYDAWSNMCKGLRCCCRCDDALIVRDNCCRCNTAAFLLTTQLTEADVHYASFNNKIYEVPFVACADTSTETIVIAIRGSMSLRDAITDLSMNDETLPLGCSTETDSDSGVSVQQPGTTGDPLDVRVHMGMLQSARYVVNVLEKQNIIDDLFVLYRDYNLVITGHSLGGGVATIVAMLLRHKYPQVRVFAFSPPGCVVNSDGLAFCNSFVCSVVLGDDLVPRMSYESLLTLKYDIVQLLEHCDKPKYQILLKGCFRLICGPQRTADTLERIGSLFERFINRADNTQADLEAPPPDPPSSSAVFTDDPDTVRTSIVTGSRQQPNRPLLGSPRVRLGSNTYGTSSDEGTSNPDGPPNAGGIQRVNSDDDQEECSVVRITLYCPGQVLHLARPVHSVDDEAQVMWTDYRRFTSIKISNRMVTDHMPAPVCDKLRLLTAAESSTYRI